MNCAVCNSPLNEKGTCPVCGFDPGRDYEAYPSLMPLEGAKPLSALRSDWQARNRDLLRCPACGDMRFQFDTTKQEFLCCSCGVRFPLQAAPEQKPVAPTEEIPTPDFSAVWWKLEEDGCLFISGQGDMDDLLPWAAKSASIRSVRVETGVRSIAPHAFASCAWLTEVYLPTGLRRIGNGAFRSCTRLEKIALPEGVEAIGADAFRYCGNLKLMSLPASLKRIGVDAFQGCDSLESILFSGSNAQWSDIGGKEALQGSRASVICELRDEEEDEGFFPWQYYPTEKTLILYSVKQIPDYSTKKAPWHKLRSSVKRIVLREGLEQIGAYAFSHMPALESVSFPRSLKRIEKSAFAYCEKLQELDLPEQLEFIGDYAFQSCTSLKALDLPETLSSLGSRAFQDCRGLRKLSLHPISDLGVSPFYCCENMERVSFCGDAGQWNSMSIKDFPNVPVEFLSASN